MKFRNVVFFLFIWHTNLGLMNFVRTSDARNTRTAIFHSIVRSFIHWFVLSSVSFTWWSFVFLSLPFEMIFRVWDIWNERDVFHTKDSYQMRTLINQRFFSGWIAVNKLMIGTCHYFIKLFDSIKGSVQLIIEPPRLTVWTDWLVGWLVFFVLIRKFYKYRHALEPLMETKNIL